MTERARLTARLRDDLTPRQREVMELIAAGKTNFEIAQALDISLEGAKYHVSEILTRLDASSREEAASIWRQRQRPVARLTRFLKLAPSLAWLRPVLAGLVLVGLVVLGLLLVLLARQGGDSSEPADTSPAAEPSTVAASAADNVPTSCPADRAAVVHPAWGPATGDGPVYASFGPPMEPGQRTMTYYPSGKLNSFPEGWGGREILVIVEDTYQDAITVSAKRLDGATPVEFIGPSQTILLPPDGGPTGWGISSASADGWRTYLPAIQMPLDAAGCYAVDFTGPGLNERITIWAALDSAGPSPVSADPPVCGTPDPRFPAPITEWIGFVRLNGRTYVDPGWLSMPRQPALSVDPSLAGREIGRVKWNVADRSIHQCHAELDGAATTLAPGTPVYALSGYREDFRVVAPTKYGWRYFEADWREGAKTAGDLLDVRGKVTAITVREGTDDKPGRTWQVPVARVEALTNMLLDEPLVFDPTVKALAEPRLMVTFQLKDSTAVERFWFAGPRAYSSGIPVSQHFLESVTVFLEEAR
jgi:DNA-binding CsgD family transcriptional regulator